jgi:D-glycero-alpha-D-manno-heptose-7-phosphate kinase
MYINVNVPAIVDKIKINYTKVEIVEVNEIGAIQHGIVREALQFLKVSGPLEIGSMADLSAGTGMGSSSAYTVGLLRALNALNRRFISMHDLAEEACKIEIDLLGKPIGKQDQYAATFGGIITLEIDRLGNVTVTPLIINQETVYELEHRLMMFYTNIQRDANEILAEQSQKARADDKAAIDAMHRIKEIGRAIKHALETDNVTEFGKLMHQHWLEKKQISQKMSSGRIDAWYEKAMHSGALGGKLMGAGGGGFFVFCAENGSRKKLRAAMEGEGLRYMNFQFDWEGCKLLVNV